MASISRNEIPLEHQRTFASLTGRDDVTPIWCLNTAQDAVDGMPSEVIITVRQADGQVVSVNIPQAALAIEATSLAPRAALVASSHFIAAVRNGLITLVTEQFAEDFNSRPLAEAERARLYQRQQAITNSPRDRQTVTDTGNHTPEIAVNRTAPNPTLAAVNTHAPVASASNIDLSALGAAAASVTAEFMSWVDSTNIMPLDRALLSFQQRGTITKQEAAYVVNTTVHAPIREFLASRV